MIGRINGIRQVGAAVGRQGSKMIPILRGLGRRTGTQAALLAGLVMANACTSEPDSSTLSSVQDSAGISIVSSARPAWDAGGWSVSDRPVLQIGVVDGDSAYQLFRVRGAIRLSDGRIAIANDGSSEIRYFDSSGRHIRSVGGSGRGPGEFMSVSVLLPFLADSLIVGDFGLRRTTLLAADGDVVLTEAGLPPVGAFSDGSVLRQAHVTPEQSLMQDGPARDEAVLIRYRLGGSESDTLARVPGNESFQVVESDGQTSATTGYRRPFGLMRTTSVFGTRIFTADGSTPEIKVLDETGTLRGLIRYNHPIRPVTSADETDYRDRFLEPIPPGVYRRRAERAVSQQAFPAAMPVLQSIMHDRVGNLWIEDYRADSSEQPSWTVLDPEGQWLGFVTTPAGFRVTDIGDDYVLGIERDELDVEIVRMYALHKKP